MKRRVIAAIAAAVIGTVGFGAARTASAESKCPVWMCGSNGTLQSGVELEAQSIQATAERVASNGTLLTGVRLPVAGR